MSTPPSGTVTFLFTDLEGSTALWEHAPLEMDAALRIHDEIVRRCTRSHGGYVFSTGGDAFAVAFLTAADGVAAAVETQRALAAQVWPSPVALVARMGLHTGEAVERDGDYFGPAVNGAARLASAAHPGQIVCSEVTVGLVRGRVAMRDLGVVRLKGVEQPERVFQPVVDGLRDDFPPLSSLAAADHNLPTQRTSLLGRHVEIQQVVELFEGHRLVTLTGVGGCGKTRMSLAVAEQLLGEFPDGVWFVELVSVNDPARVSEAVSDALGLSLSGGSGPTSVAGFVAHKDMLVVLDNCEHLLDGVASFVDELLAAGSSARVLTTSREPLDVAGEQIHRVLSLDDASALALLLERATESSDAFRLAAADKPAAVALCQRLDGIPLAIELAAPHLPLLTPRQLLDRLDGHLDVLAGGRRHRPRHRTLQAVMHWSWDLLSEDERALLMALAVFAGGWTVEAAEGACADVTSVPVVAVHRSLVAKSLIEPRRTERGTRFRMLETVRLFAHQRLADQGRLDRRRAAHRDWFIDWVERTPLDVRFWSIPWIHRCADELDNIGAAFDWSIDHGDLGHAAILLASTAGALHILLGNAQGYRWTQTLLERELEEPARVAVLTAGVIAAIGVGDHAAMEAWGAQAEQLAASTEPVVACLLLQWRGAASIVRAPERAAHLYAQASQAAEQSGSSLAKGYVAAWQLHARLCQPDGRSARVHWSPSDFGGPDSMGWSSAGTTGLLHEARQGHLAEAEALLAAVTPVDSLQPINVRGNHALVLGLAGNQTETTAEARTVLDDIDRRSDVSWRAELVLALAIAAFRAGDPIRALTYLETLRLRRAPMIYPILYDLRRDFTDRARTQLDDSAVATAISHAGSLDIETILNRELRTPFTNI